MEVFLTAVSSFLGGSLFTAMVFVFAFSNKISVMNTTLTKVSQQFDEHLTKPPVCQYHQRMSEEVAVLQSRTKHE